MKALDGLAGENPGKKLNGHDVAALEKKFSYNPLTGSIIYLLPATGRRKPQGAEATRVNRCKSGDYYVIHIGGNNVQASHIAWALHYKQIPDFSIIYKNGDGTDLRISNLIPAEATVRIGTMRKPADNTSGYKGVSWHKRDKRWRASIKHNGRLIWLGSYRTPLRAAAAYRLAAYRLRGMFSEIGKQALENDVVG